MRELDTLRTALSSVAEDAMPTADCPAPETIWAAVRGNLSGTEMRAVVDHISTCMVCAEAWEVAEDVAVSQGHGRDRVAAEESVAEQPSTSESGSPRFPWWLSAAAGVALLVVGVQWLPWQDWLSGPGYRGSEEHALRSLVSEDDPLPRNLCLLRWVGPENTDSFDLRVSWIGTDSLEVLVEESGIIGSATSEAEFRIPEARLQSLPPGAKLFWKVEAFRDGRRVATKSFVSQLE